MVIKSKDSLKKRKLEINLTGPEGNAFFILATAKKLATQLDKDWEDIEKRMKESDYENLIKVFDKEFGDYVTLYR